jgi:hypothetical protein
VVVFVVVCCWVLFVFDGVVVWVGLFGLCVCVVVVVVVCCFVYYCVCLGFVFVVFIVCWL